MATAQRSTIGKILRLLREIRVPPVYLAVPVVLAMLSAAFEGVGMGLLIPILNGFLQKSFAFITETRVPVLRTMVHWLPDSVLSNDRMLFGVLLGGFVGIFTLKTIFRYCSIVGMGYFGDRSLHHLRKALFTKYLSFGKQFFDSTNIGHHSTLLLEFTRLALNPVMVLDRYVNALFSLAVYLTVMFSISWKLTLVALPLFGILHLLIRTMILRIKRISHSMTRKGSELGKKSVEILSTIPLVKSYSTEREEQRLYTEISNGKANLDFRARIFQEMILPLQEVITMVVASFIFVMALGLFGREQIATAPALLVYFYIVLNASSKFGMLSGARGALAGATGPLDAVLEIFNDEGKYFVKGGTKEFPGLKDAIECRNLTFTYLGEREVLKGVTCRFPKGKMTAIVGPTGAGKSTLISLFMRYYDCPPGTIAVDGSDIREFSIESYLAHVALVSQETLLINDSLRANITYGLQGVTEEALTEAVERSRLAGFIGQLPEGLNTLIGDRGVRLSGGEKQRVSIARALLKGAEILILDEATSSLDSQTEKLIQEAIDEAVTGRTSIVIAHRLSTIRHADKILVLDDGRLVEQGTLDELLVNNGLFQTLWEEQKF